MNLDEIRSLVGQNKIKEALESLQELLIHSKLKNEIILTTSRFKELQESIRKGIIKYEDSSTEKNKIKNSLLEILTEIEDTYKKKFRFINKFSIISLSVITTVLAIAIIFFSNEIYKLFGKQKLEKEKYEELTNGSDTEKIVGLLGLQEIDEIELAVHYAKSYPTSYSIYALSKLINNSDKKNLVLIHDALLDLRIESDEIFHNRIDDIIERIPSTRFGFKDTIYCHEKQLNLLNIYVRNNQSEIGRLITTSMVNSAFGINKPDLGIINSGAIRLNKKIDCIRYADIITMLPFEGSLKQFKINGQLLNKILEANKINKGKGGYLQFSNCYFEELSDTWILNDMPINPNQYYNVIINNFVLKGMESNLHFLPEIVTENSISSDFKYRDYRNAFLFYLSKKSN